MNNNIIFIPIGSDCYNTLSFKNNNIRFFSLPFDWIVTINSIYEIIKNDFIDFIPSNQFEENYITINQNNNSININNENDLEIDKHNNMIFNNKYKILFLHNKFPDDNEKIQRRIKRFNEILQKSENKVIFIRKTHMNHHHNEIKNFFGQDQINDEVEEAEKLDVLLQTKYPTLDFQIVIILACDLCYCDNNKITYTTKSTNIIIENFSGKINKNFEKKYNDLIAKIKSKYST
jgi:ribosome-binding ATPase YchF (GTP1/OBG family)